MDPDKRWNVKRILQILYSCCFAVGIGYAAISIWQSEGLGHPAHLGWSTLAVSIAMLLSIALGKIDIPGGILGFFLAMAIFYGSGFNGLILLLVFFVLGSAASRLKLEWKQSVGLAEQNRGKRSAIHAFSNGGLAALFGLFAWAFPDHASLFQAMLAGTLASAMGDTFSSELGNIYGKRYINMLTWKSDERGRDGVISLEGTLLGVAGSLLIALVFAVDVDNPISWIWVLTAGIFGNLTDSLLGATLQRWGWLDNHGVNVANTVCAAAWVATGMSL